MVNNIKKGGDTMNKRRKNNYIILGLCAVLVLMGIGYAAFSSQLNITGTSNI